jgi:hypothetical protein
MIGLLALVVSLSTAGPLQADAQIRQCLDSQGRLIYQDQPCMGSLRRADIDAPMVEPGWRSASSGCRMRSPLLQIQVTPPPMTMQPELDSGYETDSGVKPAAPADPAQHSRLATAADSVSSSGTASALPSVAEPSPTADTRFSTRPLIAAAAAPSSVDDDDDPNTLGLWLELSGSSDGVALHIRGFQPLPQTAISFDPQISGQGIRLEDGAMIEVDSLDGPGSLRYGFRKSAILMRSLTGPVAVLDVRIPGWQARPTRLDAQELKDAVARVRDCVREQQALHPSISDPLAPATRRRPGS